MSDAETRQGPDPSGSDDHAMDRDMRLQDLTRRVADGTYAIDCDAVADALLRRTDPRMLSPLAPPAIRPRARAHRAPAARPAR